MSISARGPWFDFNKKSGDTKQTSARVSLLRVEIENETSQGNF